MMTKKTMTILSVFMIVALTAVGFAAWLIVGTIDAETTGSFVSNELQDKFFKVEVEFDTTSDDKNGQIIFGAPSASASTEGWLTHGANEQQKLSAIATIVFTPDGGFDLGTETMEYYLEDAAGNQRTIRVAIDIAQIFIEETEVQKADSYKWFDWAVELGYIQYPTAKLVGSEKPLAWVADESKEIGDYNKFENGCLYLDLGADDFIVDNEVGSETRNKIATAKIQIDFTWGTATQNVNPYTYFAGKQAEEKLTVVCALVEATEGVEASLNKSANEEIRNKDLAQRMLDYLSNYLSYEAPVVDDEGTVTQAQKGIQFSITLSEGTTIPKA